MSGIRGGRAWVAIASVVVGGVVVSDAAAIDGITPGHWSPSRDDAVVADSLSTTDDDVQPAAFQAERAPEGSVLPRSRLMQRPRGLSRPAPSRMRSYPSAIEGSAEALPSVTGTYMPHDELSFPPGMHFPGGSMHCGGACGEGCGDCCGQWNSCGPVHPCCLLPRPSFHGLEFFAGVEGFTGPTNRGGNGSFGFHEGFNWGIPICGCLAWQWGVAGTQSTFDGNFLTEDERNQLFLTGGFYRRVDCGLQAGLVVDYFHDEWDYVADLVQLRGELSWRFCQSDIGFWFTAGVHEANNLDLRVPQIDEQEITFTTIEGTIEANDIFAFFYRQQLGCGGEGRVFAGWTANSQSLLGADIQLPINPCWSLRAGFLYIVPDDNAQSEIPEFIEETWNVGVSLVWTPCARPDSGPNYCRPLFTVADNGSFPTRGVEDD
jgi:hypothetical protein